MAVQQAKTHFTKRVRARFLSSFPCAAHAPAFPAPRCSFISHTFRPPVGEMCHPSFTCVSYRVLVFNAPTRSVIHTSPSSLTSSSTSLSLLGTPFPMNPRASEVVVLLAISRTPTILFLNRAFGQLTTYLTHRISALPLDSNVDHR
jgi:hypothetical protein